MFHQKGKEGLKRMSVSSQQVKSMKCSTEISRWGNDNDYHFKGIFSIIVLNGFVFFFFLQLLRANKIKISLVNDVYFECPSQKK